MKCGEGETCWKSFPAPAKRDSNTVAACGAKQQIARQSSAVQGIGAKLYRVTASDNNAAMCRLTGNLSRCFEWRLAYPTPSKTLGRG